MTIEELVAENDKLKRQLAYESTALTKMQADYEARLKADMVAMLDKIRAEIKALSPEPTAYDVVDGNPIKDAVWETLADVLYIIDEYKAESEENENADSN